MLFCCNRKWLLPLSQAWRKTKTPTLQWSGWNVSSVLNAGLWYGKAQEGIISQALMLRYKNVTFGNFSSNQCICRCLELLCLPHSSILGGLEDIWGYRLLPLFLYRFFQTSVIQTCLIIRVSWTMHVKDLHFRWLGSTIIISCCFPAPSS